MNKSVLVIDAPESCMQCPLLNGSDECVMQDEDANFDADSFDDLMLRCPLKPLPEKMKVTGIYNGDYFKAGGKPPSYKIGWNECLEKIMRGAK